MNLRLDGLLPIHLNECLNDPKHYLFEKGPSVSMGKMFIWSHNIWTSKEMVYDDM